MFVVKILKHIVSFPQEFKKTLRLSDSELPNSPKKSSKFKSGNRFGSLGAIFATNHHKENLRPTKGRISKSEESLDCSKEELSDDSEEDSHSIKDDNASSSASASPQVMKKH